MHIGNPNPVLPESDSTLPHVWFFALIHFILTKQPFVFISSARSLAPSHPQSYTITQGVAGFCYSYCLLFFFYKKAQIE